MACGGGETRKHQRRLQGEEASGEERPHLDDVEELVPVDAAVSVHVVELEVPAQLVLHLSPHHQAERGHVLHEVDVAVLQNQEVLLDQMRIRVVVQPEKRKPFQHAGLSAGPV